MSAVDEAINTALINSCLANKMIEIYERDRKKYTKLSGTSSPFGDDTFDAWSDLSNDEQEAIKSKRRELLKVNPSINLEAVAYYLLIYSKDPNNSSKFKINVSAILANK